MSIGPAGFSTENFIQPTRTLPYTVEFENDGSVAAQDVTVTEQLDGLRALAIEPIGFLIVPRVVAMMISLFCLVVVGNVVAISGGALFGKILLNVELSSFLHSFADNLKPWDLEIGLIKAVAFGLAISITSCHFGTSVKGGAVGVGRAVNNAVVAAAVAIMISDNLITMVLR